MSERIQEAIKDFEHFKEMGYGHCDLPSSGNIEIALESMRERQERGNPKPLTCIGCKHVQDKEPPCGDCIRTRTDRYEPKGERE